jgi:cytoskeletal protein RodZ
MPTSQLGGYLKHAREARGLTVEAIASQTKIPTRHLQALERGDLRTLPAFYQRAEVRAVARAVGVDERVAVEQLDAVLAPPPEPQQAAPAVVKPASRVHSDYVLAACGAGALVVGLFGWGLFEGASAREGRVETNSAVAATPATSETASDVTADPAAVQEVAAPLVEPEVAPTGPTELVVRTQPAGARVTVNGIGWGISPVTIRHVEPGEKRIRVTMDGYRSSERSVMVDEGAQQTIRIRLTEGGL